jgi:hypothetical protein
MKVLCVVRDGELRFEERSLLPLSAACVVANGARERLTALFGERVELQLFEPSIPDAAAWHAICADALLYRVRGGAADVAFIVRPRDASTLAGAAFGERTVRGERLSALELEVLDRMLHAIARECAPLCGPGQLVAERTSDVRGFATYVELQIDAPVRARIGIALSRDPEPRAHPEIELDDLREVPLPVRARMALGTLTAAAAAELRPGTLLPLPAGPPRALLTLAGRLLAGGECGVHGRYYAVVIGET